MQRPLVRRSFLATFGAVGASFGCSRLRTASAAETFTMRLGLPDTATSAFGLAAVHFASGVERRSNGQLRIEVYPNGQLTSQPEAMDALVSGVLDFAIGATSYVASLAPRFLAFDLPFLFRNMDAGWRVLDGTIGRELFADLEPKGILGLGYGVNGFKEIETTSRAITTPDDMKGLRIRAQSSAYAVLYSTLGAIPITIDYSEIFTAVSQHTIEAIDTPLDSFTDGKYYKDLKHIAMANHVLSVTPLWGSRRKIETLPPALRSIVRDEAKATVTYWKSVGAQRLANAIQTLKQNGVVFTEIQYASFRKAVEPIYATAQAKVGGDLLERITRTANIATR